jgi:hypothetical protein
LRAVDSQQPPGDEGLCARFRTAKLNWPRRRVFRTRYQSDRIWVGGAQIGRSLLVSGNRARRARRTIARRPRAGVCSLSDKKCGAPFGEEQCRRYAQREANQPWREFWKMSHATIRAKNSTERKRYLPERLASSQLSALVYQVVARSPKRRDGLIWRIACGESEP